MEKALSGAESLTPLPLFAREPLANDQRRGRGAEQEQHRRCRDGGGRAAARSARSAVMPAAAAMLVAAAGAPADRKRVGLGKSVSVRVDLVGRRIIKKKIPIITEPDTS